MAELHWRGKEREQSRPKTDAILRIREVCGAIVTPVSRTEEAREAWEVEGWQNRLIQGERATVLAALLPEFAGRVDLIYIDPPFMTERDFMSGERLAYSDKWQGELDLYLEWLATTLRLLYQLLAEDGRLYLHLYWPVGLSTPWLRDRGFIS